MRQRLQRVVQVDAGQRLVQLAVLLAHALAIDDEQRRTELRDQALDLGLREGINESARARFARASQHRCFQAKRGRIVGADAGRVMTDEQVTAAQEGGPQRGRFVKVRRHPCQTLLPTSPPRENCKPCWLPAWRWWSSRAARKRGSWRWCAKRRSKPSAARIGGCLPGR